MPTWTCGHFTAHEKACHEGGRWISDPSGSTFVFAGFAREGENATGHLSAVDLKNGTVVWEKKFDGLRPTEAAISPDGKVLATYLQPMSNAKSGARLAIWSVHDGQELLRFNLVGDSVRSLALSPDCSHLVSGMELGDVLVWDISSAHEKLK
jgi:WD40 repeat protein